MRKWIGLFVIAACVASAPASAGLSFKQTMRNSGGGGPKAAATVTVSRVQMEGGDARIDFEMVADNPLFASGGYMLLRSAPPKGMFLVNPEKETFMAFDPEGLSQSMAPVGQAMEGVGMKMAFTDVKMEKVLEEDGDPIEGFSTTHYRYHKTYVMTMHMMNMKMITAHDVIEDIWLTNDIRLEAGSFDKVMKQVGGSPMLEGMEKLAALEGQMAKGFTLKRVTVDRSTPQGKGMMARMMGGKEQTVTTTLTVEDLKKGTIAARTFAIPSGFTEIQMMQPGATTPDLEDDDEDED